MKKSSGSKRSGWFWVGIILLALLLLIFIPIIVAEPAIFIIIFAMVLLTVPVGTIIYGARRGRKAPAVEVEEGSEPAYPTAKPTQEMQQGSETAYLSQPAAKVDQRKRIRGGFLAKLKEKLRDKTRDEVCAGLCSIGLDARMAVRRRTEERVGEKCLRDAMPVLTRYTVKGKSQGVIEIRGSPIGWVNVVKGADRGAPGGGSYTVYSNTYLIKDPAIREEGYITCVGVKSRPVFGRVVDLRWERKWKGKVESDLIRRLNEDVLLNQSLLELKEAIEINSYPKYGYWAILSRSYPAEKKVVMKHLAPSRKHWECYETIARHLLEPSVK